MATRNMPGTPKQRSVGRPAQGHGKLPASPGRPKGLRAALATPTYRRATGSVGSLSSK